MEEGNVIARYFTGSTPLSLRLQSSISSRNISKDTEGAEDCRVRVSRWRGLTGRSANHRRKHSQHILPATDPLSSGFHEESFFHLRHLFFLN